MSHGLPREDVNPRYYMDTNRETDMRTETSDNGLITLKWQFRKIRSGAIFTKLPLTVKSRRTTEHCKGTREPLTFERLLREAPQHVTGSVRRRWPLLTAAARTPSRPRSSHLPCAWSYSDDIISYSKKALKHLATEVCSPCVSWNPKNHFDRNIFYFGSRFPT